jgi:hypothetical protein
VVQRGVEASMVIVMAPALDEDLGFGDALLNSRI